MRFNNDHRYLSLCYIKLKGDRSFTCICLSWSFLLCVRECVLVLLKVCPEVSYCVWMNVLWFVKSYVLKFPRCVNECKCGSVKDYVPHWKLCLNTVWSVHHYLVVQDIPGYSLKRLSPFTCISLCKIINISVSQSLNAVPYLFLSVIVIVVKLLLFIFISWYTAARGGIDCWHHTPDICLSVCLSVWCCA